MARVFRAFPFLELPGRKLRPRFLDKSYIVKIVLDTARWKCYFSLHSRSGSPLLKLLSNNRLEPIMKTTLGKLMRTQLESNSADALVPGLARPPSFAGADQEGS
jgi:hypothetical protein